MKTGLIAGIVLCLLLVFGATMWLRPIRQLVQPKRYPHEHLQTSALEPLAQLHTSEYKIRGGETLASVAKLRYGHQNYFGVIKLYNHIEDERQIAANQTLRVPGMSAILAQEGLTKVIPQEVNLILCSRAKYDMIVDRLRASRYQTGNPQLPEDIKQQLWEAADDLWQATESLKVLRPGVTAAPLSMIGQLEQCMAQIRIFADTGQFDSYGYDIDMVQQHYALALTYAIEWARDGFK